MRRFHIHKDDIEQEHVVLRENEARHAVKVLRLRRNEKVRLFDDDGNEYLGIIKDPEPGRVQVGIIETKAPAADDACEIVLAQALLKSDKMNLLFRQCTELGISKIIPVISARTVPRWSSAAADSKQRHWREIVIAAVKQSGIRRVPIVERAVSFDDAMGREYSGYLKLILCERERKNSLKSILRARQAPGRIIFMVGPEGGFTDHEIQTAREKGFQQAGLGKLILRAETVPMAVLSIIRYEYDAME